MATLTLTFPNDQAVRIRDAVCTRFGYQDQVPHATQPGVFISNPETKSQFSQRMLVEALRRWVKEAEGQAASKAAFEAAAASVDAITITGS